MKKWINSFVICSLLLLQSPAFGQGGLTPPAAPAPTMKTLEQIEPRIPISGSVVPFNISSSGSYVLTTNISAVGSAILINASHVTLDLNGFQVTGGGLEGAIYAVSVLNNIKILNGTVSGYQGISASNTTSLQLEDIRLAGCVEGVHAGNQARFKKVSLSSHLGRFGIRGQHGCLVQEVTMSGGSSVASINVGDGSIVENCTISSLQQTTAASFTGVIEVGSGSVVRNCTITRCSVGQNNFIGINLGIRGLAEHCVVGSNTNLSAALQAIVANVGSTVRDCTVSGNAGDGIVLFGNCLIEGNNAYQNRNGIFSLGSGINRVENNLFTQNVTGLNVQNTGNMIVRNHASNNSTNYVIVSGNKVGVIVSAPVSGAISGSTGGSGVGTNDAWANFSY